MTAPDESVTAASAATATLARPLTLPCGQVLPNRIAKAAMTEGLADARMNATPAHERLYRRWSHGGAGLLITGNVQIDRWDLERPGNVVIDGAADRAALARWASAGTAGGSQIWMQLSHAGRQAPFYCSPTPVAPSARRLRLLGAYRTPSELTVAGIEQIVERFAAAARLAWETGFTGVQIHAAHGYLLSEFLSPAVNRRRDDYGGSLANRARLLLAVVRAVRRAVGPGFAVAVKLNSADFQKGGFDDADCVQVVHWLNELAVDLIEISGGSYEQPRLLGHEGDADRAEAPRASTRAREAYFLEYAARVRRAARMPVMVTGGFRSRDAMAAAIDEDGVDVIGLGRPLCVDPFFVARLFEGTTEAAADPGAELAYGRGVLGPRSGITALRFINIFSQMGWYYVQLFRLGRGAEPHWRLPLWRGLLGHVAAELRSARVIRAFQKQAAQLR
ncbi:NADH:flavin oxidoreductase [Salinisphaera orenii MK-B5]|uniref:NADH:flavin oxidoreductase n=1 Tax=Salinisphaera orenii MK-B5 TaxID=856730 RepID=A0A423PM35_9GAMM|nr:NADH:flavin oxidoreductase/NADH oxidase family protein [Salinisphaera orenii]ROO26647.1 NADH:flavin oxidoreductase [Salinisphaera orenii MK-B5]